MLTKKEFNLNNFLKVDDIDIFRLENGDISVEEIGNLIIPLKMSDRVELITMSKEGKNASFFKINDTRINSIFVNSFVNLPEDSEFTDMYITEIYDGVYCKYTSCEKEGIIYVSETEIAEVISHEAGYGEIWFENEVFFAKKTSEEKYYAIGQAGIIVLEKDFKFKKVKDFELFYSEKRLFTKASEIKIPFNIKSVEVIQDILYYNQDEMRKVVDFSGDIQKAIKNYNPYRDVIISTKIKVYTERGIYFYNSNLELLAGPLKNPSIINICEEKLGDFKLPDFTLPFFTTREKSFGQVLNVEKIEYYIFDYNDEDKLVSISYIVNDSAVNKISSPYGFEIRTYFVSKECEFKKKKIMFFTTKDKIYDSNLRLICKNLDNFKVKEIENKFEDYFKSIHLIAKDIEGNLYYNYSTVDSSKIWKKLTFAFDGIQKNVKIYKSGNCFVCLDLNYNFIFSVEAKSASIKEIIYNGSTASSGNIQTCGKVYMFEKKDKCLLYDETGIELKITRRQF